ncbi:MAG: [Fe-Fe] hydrogenase large subunit C-terminal domain-containing protein, partial [Methylocystaceae bacterium]
MRYELTNVISMAEENCTNCHQCIAVCPSKFCNNGSGNTVKLNQNLCIGCGHCVAACVASHNGLETKAARHYIDDADALVNSLKKQPIAALIAPSAQSNFDLPRLITALKTLGFTAVYDVALGAEITVACYHQLLEEQLLQPPLIAQPCPAIVKYIELNHPGLLPHLAPIGSPVHNIAVNIKASHPEYSMAFISPCLAKSREFKDSGLIDYNVTFKSIDNILQQQNICLADLEPGTFNNEILAGIAASFSSPGGLKESYLHHYPTTPGFITRVSGKIVYDKYLADLETAIINKSPHLPLIVDILNCENGCNMGPGCINHNHSIDEVEIAIAVRAEQNLQQTNADNNLSEFLNHLVLDSYRYDYYRDLSSNQHINPPSGLDLSNIYGAMLKTGEKDYRNCGACGYNSCYRMAIAIFNGLNKPQNCHLYQEKTLRNDQERFQTIAREIARAFNEVQGGVAELSSNAGVTLNNFNEVISNIGSFRAISTEMADKAEDLTPIVQTISSIAKTLQEQLYFLQQMIDTIPTPIFFRDTDGVFQG